MGACCILKDKISSKTLVGNFSSNKRAGWCKSLSAKYLYSFLASSCSPLFIHNHLSSQKGVWDHREHAIYIPLMARRSVYRWKAGGNNFDKRRSKIAKSSRFQAPKNQPSRLQICLRFFLLLESLLDSLLSKSEALLVCIRAA